MGHIAPPPPPLTQEDELVRNLQQWREDQPVPPTADDVLATDDSMLLAAYLIEAFRAAAAEQQTRNTPGPPGALRKREDIGDAAFRVFRGLSEAWALTGREQFVLLGLSELRRDIPTPRLPAAQMGLFERLAVLLDIFRRINTLLPIGGRADAWVRAPNRAPMFNDGSALELMLEGAAQMQEVRTYLLAEVNA